jgi:hypothetical protein
MVSSSHRVRRNVAKKNKSDTPVVSVEIEKNTLIIDNVNSGEVVRELLHDLYNIKKPLSEIPGSSLSTRNRRQKDQCQIHPFEENGFEMIKRFCKITESPLFIIGSRTKKQPLRLNIGRLYNNNDRIIDIQEWIINNYQPISSFTDNDASSSAYVVGSKPLLIFQVMIRGENKYFFPGLLF